MHALYSLSSLIPVPKTRLCFPIKPIPIRVLKRCFPYAHLCHLRIFPPRSCMRFNFMWAPCAYDGSEGEPLLVCFESLGGHGIDGPIRLFSQIRQLSKFRRTTFNSRQKQGEEHVSLCYNSRGRFAGWYPRAMCSHRPVHCLG